ncbi:MAG TPA: DUF4270 domain-containing protein [Bacteroidia bacterium]|nr:DUF4270 domain-containing protein [Bacteroidia bacterium]
MINRKEKHLLLRTNLSAKFFLAFLALLGIGITSCNKTSVIGLNVQPKSDLLNVSFKDTTTIIAYSVKEDSIISNKTTYSLLGSYNDPVFGNTSASIYAQVLLPNGLVNVNMGPTGQVLDSAVLVLPYALYYYGNLDPQTIQVYQVTQDFYQYNSYYSNDNLSIGQLIGSKLVFPQPTTGSSFGEPQLRIHLDKTFCTNTFLKQSGSANLASNASFVSFLKGIYITTANGYQYPHQGGILAFNLTDPICGIQLYYRNPKLPPYLAGNNITFNINAGSAYFDNFTHNFRHSSIIATNVDTTLGTNNVYVQSMAGVKVKIKMPYLENWKDSGQIVVNKAEFDVSVNNALTESSYPVPPQLYLVGIDSVGGEIILPDENQGSNYFGGTYNAATSSYSFNIAMYVQQVLSGKIKNRGLYLVAGGSAINADRVVLNGGLKTNPGKMRLKLTYTKLY